MQGWTQHLQNLLYWRLPFSPRKNAHSRRHFLLRLISRPAPGVSSAGQACPGLSATHTPALRPPAAPEQRAFSPAWFCAPRPGLSPIPRHGGRCDDPVAHPIIVLQGHFRRAQRVFRLHGNGYDLPVNAGEQIWPFELLDVLPACVRGAGMRPSVFSPLFFV